MPFELFEGGSASWFAQKILAAHHQIPSRVQWYAPQIANRGIPGSNYEKQKEKLLREALRAKQRRFDSAYPFGSHRRREC